MGLPESGNRFARLIDAGRVKDAAGLKRAFRTLAKRVHPDLSPGAEPRGEARSEAGGEAGMEARAEAGGKAGAQRLLPPEAAARAFIALRAEYEAALRYLDGREPGASAAPPPRPRTQAASALPAYAWNRAGFYSCLEDLLARGFPSRPASPGPAKLYDASRAEVLAYLRGREGEDRGPSLLSEFLDFEAGYAAFPSAGGFLGAGAEVRRLLYLFLSNALGYHRLGFAHIERIARSLMPLIEDRLRNGGQERAIPFLRFLLADLEKGPAFPD